MDAQVGTQQIEPVSFLDLQKSSHNVRGGSAVTTGTIRYDMF